MYKTKIGLFILLFLSTSSAVFASGLSISPAEIYLEMELNQKEEISFTLARENFSLEQSFNVASQGDYLSGCEERAIIPAGERELSYSCFVDSKGAELGEYKLELTFTPQEDAGFLRFGLTANIYLLILDEVQKPLDLSELDMFSDSVEISLPNLSQQFFHKGDTLGLEFEIKNKSAESLTSIPYQIKVFHKNRLLESKNGFLMDLPLGENLPLDYSYSFHKIGPHIVEITLGELSQRVEVTVYPELWLLMLVTASLIALLALFLWSKKLAKKP